MMASVGALTSQTLASNGMASRAIMRMQKGTGVGAQHTRTLLMAAVANPCRASVASTSSNCFVRATAKSDSGIMDSMSSVPRRSLIILRAVESNADDDMAKSHRSSRIHGGDSSIRSSKGGKGFGYKDGAFRPVQQSDTMRALSGNSCPQTFDTQMNLAQGESSSFTSSFPSSSH